MTDRIARRMGFSALLCLLLTWPSAAKAGDHATAQALVAQLTGDSAHRAVLASALDDAEAALERATRMRAAGDDAHAVIADGLALEWAETARDLRLAADAETAAANLRRKALTEEARLDRSRALVAEEIARVGRLRAKVERRALP